MKVKRLVCVLTFLLAGIGFSGNGNAAAVRDLTGIAQIDNKILADDIQKCYSPTDGAFKASITLGNFGGWSDLISDGGKKVPLFGKESKTIKCDDLLAELFNINTGDFIKTNDEGDEILRKLGYTPPAASNSGKTCIGIKFKWAYYGSDKIETEDASSSSLICSTGGSVKKGDLKLETNTSDVINGMIYNHISFGLGDNGKYTDFQTGTEKNCDGLYLKVSPVENDANAGASNTCFQYSEFNSLDELAGKIANYIPTVELVYDRAKLEDNPPLVPHMLFDKTDYKFSGVENGLDEEYTLDGYAGSAMIAAKNLFGEDFGGDDFIFSNTEAYVLYQKYLNDVYKSEIKCPSDESGADGYSHNSSFDEVKWASGGELKTCYASTDSADKDISVNGLNNSRFFMGPPISYNDLINQMNSFASAPDFDVGAVAEIGATATTDDSDPDSAEVNKCYENAIGLGHVLCTILDMAAKAAGEAYDNYVEPSLRIDPKLFSGTSDATKQAWEYFRNIANILFVIFLLAVIFSQVTGVGIDNYGIKKILPKLIVAAILVNLSYWICVACVDLSNIIGNGIKIMFDNLSLGSVPQEIQSQAGGGGLISIGIIGALGIGTWSIVVSPGILLSLLVSVLGVAISIFFLFVLLAAREAVIVVLVVLSPLAFVCYMLPNTKKLFDKYIRLSEAMLLLYPIIGLLVGGGNFVSRLLIHDGFQDDLVSSFTAMLVGIVPVFFVPTLLKNSFSALGNLGAKISGFGERVRGGAERGMRNSDRYKNAQERSSERARRLSLRRRSGGYVGEDGQFHERNNLRTRLARSRFGQMIGSDRAMGKARSQYVQEEASRLDDIANMSEGIANASLTKAANARDRRVEEGNVGVARESAEIIRRDLENERMKAEVEVELGPKPLLNRDNLRVRTQNAINEAEADNSVPVLAVDVDLATQRKQSARDAQEFKAFQDQFAGFTPADIRTQVYGGRDSRGNTVPPAASWFNPNDASSVQRMRALINHMNANGMENDVFSMLSSTHGIGDSAAVLSELAGSNNKVMQAYGKRAARADGTSVDFADFMNGTGHNSMAGYVEDKGKDFVRGLDDKALSQIRQYSDSSGHNIMSTKLLMEAAASTNSQDAVNEIDTMLSTRSDIARVGVTGEQLVQINDSTFRTLSSSGDGRNAILRASDDIVENNPRLASQMSADRKRTVNGIRGSRRTPIA